MTNETALPGDDELASSIRDRPRKLADETRESNRGTLRGCIR
jgi:hypothetical protein